MRETAATDNSHVRPKLDLRRYFLGKYHAQRPAKVFDACQGSGLLWATLRREFALGSYWGVDVKKHRGRLKVDSVRVLALPGAAWDVVDIDTYGQPWNHWSALLANRTRLDRTVFVTIAENRTGMGSTISQATRQALGIGSLTLTNGFGPAINRLAVPYLLAAVGEWDYELVEVAEALGGGNARYLGVRLVARDG